MCMCFHVDSLINNKSARRACVNGCRQSSESSHRDKKLRLTRGISAQRNWELCAGIYKTHSLLNAIISTTDLNSTWFKEEGCCESVVNPVSSSRRAEWKAGMGSRRVSLGSSTPVPGPNHNFEQTGQSLKSGLLRITGYACLCSLLKTFFLFAVLAQLCFHSVESSNTCKVSLCWDRYNTAREAMAVLYIDGLSTLGPGQVECVALRTYAQCIRNVTRGCLGTLEYHSVKKVVHNQMRLHNCSNNGPVYKPSIHGTRRLPHKLNPNSECAFTGKRVYKHCGLFGDPHLKTFNNEFQTCRVRGAWPLINNRHVTVQVTNDPVGRDGAATATSKLTVVIKRNDDCSANRFLMYQATTDYLPATFADGQTSHGPERAVEIVELEPGKHIEIHVRFIDTTIIIRQIGRYFTFSVKMPEEVINNSSPVDVAGAALQLCLHGCPKRERFNYHEFFTQKHEKLKSENSAVDTLAMSQEKAVVLCRQAGLVDFYFDSCVFDLMTTGDQNFTLAAFSAYQDVLQNDPGIEDLLDNRQDFETYRVVNNVNKKSSAPPRTSSNSVFLGVVLTIISWMLSRQYNGQSSGVL